MGRTLKEVIDLVDRWRGYYEGVFDPATNQKVKYSLKESADLVGVPKKSLDDYATVLKKAKSFGFNIEKNLNVRFGLLRGFVKKAQASVSSEGNGVDFSDFVEEKAKEDKINKKSKKITKN